MSFKEKLFGKLNVHKYVEFLYIVDNPDGTMNVSAGKTRPAPGPSASIVFTELAHYTNVEAIRGKRHEETINEAWNPPKYDKIWFYGSATMRARTRKSKTKITMT